MAPKYQFIVLIVNNENSTILFLMRLSLVTRIFSNKLCSYCLADQATEIHWLKHRPVYPQNLKKKQTKRWYQNPHIRNIAIKFIKRRGGSRLFDRWRFIFFIFKRVSLFKICYILGKLYVRYNRSIKMLLLISFLTLWLQFIFFLTRILAR